MNFVKMLQFTRLVKAAGRLREFNFRNIRTSPEGLFSVNVCNDRGDRIHFNMDKKDNAWRIREHDLPAWILDNEKQLDEAIEEEIRSAS